MNPILQLKGRPELRRAIIAIVFGTKYTCMFVYLDLLGSSSSMTYCRGLDYWPQCSGPISAYSYSIRYFEQASRLHWY